MTPSPSRSPRIVLPTVVAALTALLGTSFAPAVETRLGQEIIPASENADILDVTQSILGKLIDEKAANPSSTVHRDAHPKAHGCVKASFTVLPGIPSSLKHGLFAVPETYKAWIRYSNGSPPIDKADSKPDGRGMAIKVLGVPGAKILPNDETGTQDFLMIHNDVFFVRNAHDYVSFQRNPILFGLLRPFHEGKLIFQTAAKAITNPFSTRYWSMTPYRLGSDHSFSAQAIKYTAYPVLCPGQAQLHNESGGNGPDFLREAMIKTMKTGDDVCFAFAVQPQIDPEKTPIEDPTISWDKAGAPFTQVATIRITAEKNNGKLGPQNVERTRFCENIAISPWHALPEHRPLGGINRARKTVYQTISTYRRDQNGVAPFEPTGDENF